MNAAVEGNRTAALVASGGVMLGGGFRGFSVVVLGLDVVAVREMGVMSSLVVVPVFVVLVGFVMVLGGMLVMLGGVSVMLASGMRHRLSPLRAVRRDSGSLR